MKVSLLFLIYIVDFVHHVRASICDVISTLYPAKTLLFREYAYSHALYSHNSKIIIITYSKSETFFVKLTILNLTVPINLASGVVTLK